MSKALWDREQRRRGGYVGTILVNLILVYVFHHLLAWRVPFITPAFADVLWVIDLSLEATILANLAFLIYDAAWFRNLIQIGLTVIAFVVTSDLYAVYPFDFGSSLVNETARFGLLLVMAALVIAAIVQSVLLLVRAVPRGLQG